MNEWLMALAIPFGGWMLYVERRLTVLVSLKDQLNSVDSKVERLVDHLIGKA